MESVMPGGGTGNDSLDFQTESGFSVGLFVYFCLRPFRSLSRPSLHRLGWLRPRPRRSSDVFLPEQSESRCYPFLWIAPLLLFSSPWRGVRGEARFEQPNLSSRWLGERAASEKGDRTSQTLEPRSI